MQLLRLTPPCLALQPHTIELTPTSRSSGVAQAWDGGCRFDVPGCHDCASYTVTSRMSQYVLFDGSRGETCTSYDALRSHWAIVLQLM